MLRFFFVSLFRWASFPVAAAVASSTALSFAPGPWGFLASLLGLLAFAVWSVALLVSTLRALSQKNGKRAVALPIVFVSTLPMILLAARSGDYIHLAALYPYYLSKIHERPDWETTETRFPWGDAAVTVLDGTQLRVLIYDATGKITLGDAPGPEAGIRSNVQHLMGNFYLDQVSTN